MADEQIKQNAEIRVFTENSFRKAHKKLILTPSEEKIAKNFYIAGAHSRDEEIEELRKLLFEKECDIQFLEHKLRNPWISVEDRLPDIGQKVITITNKGKMLLVARTTQPPHKEEGGWRWEHYIGKVTHWMPIPELKKGE